MPRLAAAATAALLGLALAACPGPAARSPGGDSESARTTAAPSDPPPEGTASAAPTGDEAAIIEAFFDLASDEALTFQVSTEGSIDTSVGRESGVIEVTSDMDVRGRDAVGDFALAAGTQEQVFELLILDERAYARQGGSWEEIPEFRQDQPVNPFVLLSGPEDLEYVELARIEGEEVHRLRSRVWLGGDVQSLEQEGWENPQIEESEFEVLVRPDGTPVRADFTGTLTGEYNEQPAEVGFDFTYRFSEVGEPVEIPDPAGG